MGLGSGLNLIARHAERSAAWLAHQSGGKSVHGFPWTHWYFGGHCSPKKI
jgi:hypothetical protein